MKLTEKSVLNLKLPPDRRQLVVTDDQVAGLQVVVSRTTASFAAQGVVDGRNRRVTLAPVGSITLAEARLRAAAVRDQMARGVQKPDAEAPDPRRATLSMVWADVQKSAWWRTRRQNTQTLYELAWRDHLRPWGGGRLLIGVKLQDLVELWQKVTDDGARRQGMARTAIIVFKRIWSHAARRGLLGERPPPSPAQYLGEELPGWSAINVRSGDVTDEELVKLWPHLHEDSQNARCIRLLTLTGMRSQEAAGLRWGEIDLDRRLITLPASRTKTKRDVKLPITDAVYELLNDCGLAHMPVENWRDFMKVDYLVFENLLHRRRAKIADPGDTLTRLCRQAGIARKTPHMLRKTYTRIAYSVAGMEIASRLTSHSVGTSIVDRHYLNFGDQELREAAEKVVAELARRAMV